MCYIEDEINDSIKQFGFAQVLVKKKQGNALLGDRTYLKQLPETKTKDLPLGAAAASVSGPPGQPHAPQRQSYPLLGLEWGFIDIEGLRTLSADDMVEKVYLASEVAPVLQIDTKSARSNEKRWALDRLALKSIWQKGITGQGVRVGHLDTGIDGGHIALKERLKAFLETDFFGRRVENDRVFRDSGGHGTHTAGIICGGRVSKVPLGIALEAELYSCMVMPGGASLPRILEGLEWALEKQVKVLCLPFGYYGYKPFIQDIIATCRARGALPVAAIGNEGIGTSRSPGNYEHVLSVGAVDEQGRVPAFSSSVAFNRERNPIVPCVVAPGVDVVSAKPGGGVSSMSGTSMATAVVAGVAALLFQVKQNATPDQVQHTIQVTCENLPQDRTRRGFGLINPGEAIRFIESMKSDETPR